MKKDRRHWNRSIGASTFGLFIAASIPAVPISVQAQEFDTRTRIEDRSRPDFASPPIRVGAFDIRPTVEVGVEAIENLFASDVIDVDDAIVSIKPAVSVRDRRSDRELRLDLSTGYQSFLKNNAEDRFQLLGRARARFGLGTDTRIFGGATARLNDTSGLRLTEGGNVAQPLQSFTYGANGGVSQDIGRISLETEARIQFSEYDGLLFFRGQSLDANTRDSSIFAIRTRAAYSARPDRRFYFEGRAGRFDFDNHTFTGSDPATEFLLANRSGKYYSLVAGVQFEVTELFSVDANAGYNELRYNDSTRPTLRAFSAEVNAYYSPSRLTRFQLGAVRSVDDSTNPLFNSFLRTGFSLAAEHELRRDLVLRADAEFTTYESQNSDQLANVIDIGDELRLRASAVYFVAPRVSLRVNAEHFERSGFAPGSQQRLLFSVGYSF